MDDRFKNRFYNKLNNKMIYGPAHDRPSPSWVLSMCESMGINPDQCTGIKCNSKDLIYENDIVLFKPYPMDNPEIGVITFDKDHARFEIISTESVIYVSAGKIITILGNTHQNKWLLEV